MKLRGMAIEDCTHQKMGFSPYILLQKYIMLLLGHYRQKFYPPPPLKVFGRRLERMDRSPIENNPRPTLRGTSTCFRGSPGGWKVPTTYPPYPLFNAPALVCSGLGGCEGYRRCREESGNLSPEGESFRLYSPPQRFVQVRLCIGPLKGANRGGEKEGFPQGFVEYLGLLLPVCLVMLRGKPLIMSIGSFPHKAETLIIFTPHGLSRCVRA